MAKEKTPCPTCHQLFTKVFRRYELKPCSPGDTIKFLVKFPPKLSGIVDLQGAEKQPADAGKSNTDNKYFKKSDRRRWIMYKDGAEGKRNNLKTDTRPWILENVKDKGKYKGKAKPVDNNMYYMVQFDGKRMGDPLVVYPIKSWYEFESEIQHKTLTTEEAENIIKSRKRNDEGYSRWIVKESGENDKMEYVDGQHENDETRKQKQIKIEDDSDHDEEEKKSNPDENDLPKGEDWEHEGGFTDDNLSTSSEDSESEGVPSDMSDFENEKVTESGKEMKNILKNERLAVNDVHEPVEKAENNDESNAVNEKDCYDGKDKRKATKEDVEMKDARNAEKPTTEQKHRKRKATEVKLQESEAHQPSKKAKDTSRGKSQESEAQKKENEKPSLDMQLREFLQEGKDKEEMRSFLRQNAKGKCYQQLA